MFKSSGKAVVLLAEACVQKLDMYAGSIVSESGMFISWAYTLFCTYYLYSFVHNFYNTFTPVDVELSTVSTAPTTITTNSYKYIKG